MVIAPGPTTSGTAARWPAWFAPAGFLIGLGATLVLGALVGGIAIALGGSREGSPFVTAIATLLQAVAFVGTAVLLARRLGRTTPQDFGLRPTPLPRAAAAAVAALVGFYLLSAAYAAVVRPSGDQDVLEALGADEGTGYLLLTAVVVLVVAPFAEELFFRGFCYRCLRNRFSAAAAAAIVGVVFGSIHYSGTDTLSLLPLLAILGVSFCLLYELTGSLFPAIAMHAVNNTVAFVVTADGASAPAIGLLLGGATVTACFLLTARMPANTA